MLKITISNTRTRTNQENLGMSTSSLRRNETNNITPPPSKKKADTNPSKH